MIAALTFDGYVPHHTEPILSPVSSQHRGPTAQTFGGMSDRLGAIVLKNSKIGPGEETRQIEIRR